MPYINRNRLHLLIALIAAIGAFAWGILHLYRAYPPFLDSFRQEYNRQAVPTKTGKSYQEWLREGTESCRKQIRELEAKGESPDYIRNFGRLCNSPGLVDLPSQQMEFTAFAQAFAVRATIYVVVAVFLLPWFVGFVLAKGVPSVAGALRNWLTER